MVQATLTQRYTERAGGSSSGTRRSRSSSTSPTPCRTSRWLLPKSITRRAAPDSTAMSSPNSTRASARCSKPWRRAGVAGSTLVFFTSDNGPWFGGSSGGLRGMKGSTFEGGYRVPMIARWPGNIPAGHVSAQPAVMMDLFATVLKAADAAARRSRARRPGYFAAAVRRCRPRRTSLSSASRARG